MKNKICKHPIVDDNKLLTGIGSVTDLGIFLLPTRRPSQTLSKLQAISRGRGSRCDSCDSVAEIQCYDSCNRLMCRACEDERHTIDLP